MCSIAGFSLSRGSVVSPRKLSRALLVEMDVRGNQASGFAWQSPSGAGVFKKDVAGAQLPTKSMPKDAGVVVLHTRYATHGTIKNMANNHPVLSPDKSISLVHNGVIYNHDIVRTHLDATLPEVDTAVIPAILEQFGRDADKFSMLDGDASVAWLDDADRMTLKVARISHSPLVIAQLADGSFVFASTETILLNALKSIDLPVVYMEVVPERVLMTVRDGRLCDVEALPSLDPAFEQKFEYATSKYRDMTSGGWGSADTLGYKFNAPSTAFGGGELYQFEGLVEQLGYPIVSGMVANEFGEYFDEVGNYMGSFDDLVETGYIRESDFYSQEEQVISARTSVFAERFVDEVF